MSVKINERPGSIISNNLHLSRSHRLLHHGLGLLNHHLRLHGLLHYNRLLDHDWLLYHYGLLDHDRLLHLYHLLLLGLRLETIKVGLILLFVIRTVVVLCFVVILLFLEKDMVNSATTDNNATERAQDVNNNKCYTCSSCI